MIGPRTQARLMLISLWKPPRGVNRIHVLQDDGSITVCLEAGGCQESLTLCPKCSTDGVHEMLGEAAARLLDAGARESGRAEREAEARVEQQLACADSVFRDGLKRATRKGRRP